ncbi:DnaJ domain-containing protein [Albidovulum sp.]
MSRPDPFGFDISAASDKKKRAKGRRGMSGAFETSTRVCDHAGCEEPGQYRAPQSPDRLDEYFWFCREHIRQYNLKWNYFQGQTEEEFQQFLDRERVWGRATRPFGKQKPEDLAWARLGVSDPMEILGENATRNRGAAEGRRLPPTERKALEILDAKESWTKTEVRRQYKSLVKDLHPDMNGGNRDDEERLQQVVWAWEQIKASRHFRD